MLKVLVASCVVGTGPLNEAPKALTFPVVVQKVNRVEVKPDAVYFVQHVEEPESKPRVEGLRGREVEGPIIDGVKDIRDIIAAIKALLGDIKAGWVWLSTTLREEWPLIKADISQAKEDMLAAIARANAILDRLDAIFDWAKENAYKATGILFAIFLGFGMISKLIEEGLNRLSGKGK